MKHKLLFIISFLLFSELIYGQAVVSGVVRDATTDETLVGVNVYLENKSGSVDHGVATDINGKYSIEVPVGIPILNFSFVGYQAQAQSLVTHKGQQITLNIYMKTEAGLLEGVVVSAGRFEQKLSEVTVSMEVVKVEDLSKQNTQDIS
ncbi:MAG: carboxypeptidase-like regulatory domain-containing protein, partial [Bacteroidales bacterium]|nr:carboxypeptidase-like regulatory domain-containing protein [Bacteroidales bacterium]